MSRRRGPVEEPEPEDDSPPARDAAVADRGSGVVRAVLFAVLTEGAAGDDFDELRRLCTSAGIEPVADLAQARRSPTPSHYLGTGKVEELATLVAGRRASLAVCDDELSPVQAERR